MKAEGDDWFRVSAANASEYLSTFHPIPSGHVQELGGGVSSVVLLVENPESRFVIKQALPRLRVNQEWLCDPGRIFRESAALRWLAPLLPPGTIPEVLFEDTSNYLFAMTAAPATAETWKSQLLRGNINKATAIRAGELLTAIWRVTWNSPECASAFGDQTMFHELRLDPYYGSIMRVHPDLAARINSLMENSGKRRWCLVHGDWSPKNLLVAEECVIAIDFEVCHYGDPSFDAAFLLNHLALKAFFLSDWKSQYRAAAMDFWKTVGSGLPESEDWFEKATVSHLAGLMLARIDGKSPVEYIVDDRLRSHIRGFSRNLIEMPPSHIEDVFDAI